MNLPGPMFLLRLNRGIQHPKNDPSLLVSESKFQHRTNLIWGTELRAALSYQCVGEGRLLPCHISQSMLGSASILIGPAILAYRIFTMGLKPHRPPIVEKPLTWLRFKLTRRSQEIANYIRNGARKQNIIPPHHQNTPRPMPLL